MWGEAAVVLRSYLFPARGPDYADHTVGLVHMAVLTTWDLYKMESLEKRVCVEVWADKVSLPTVAPESGDCSMACCLPVYQGHSTTSLEDLRHSGAVPDLETQSQATGLHI